MSANAHPALANRLIGLMDAADRERLVAAGDRVVLQARGVIEESHAPLEHVHFPLSGIVSVMAVDGDGEAIEVGLVGPEGMTGLPVLHGTDRWPNRAMVQITGEAFRIGVEDLAAALAESPALSALLARFAQAFLVQVGQSALAGGRYTLGQRLSRWLLMCHDRLDGDDIPITHEFLSTALGVRRPGITTALHELEGAQLVRARRSRILVLDRAGLEATAGQSYGVAEREYRRLLGIDPRGRGGRRLDGATAQMSIKA